MVNSVIGANDINAIIHEIINKKAQSGIRPLNAHLLEKSKNAWNSMYLRDNVYESDDLKIRAHDKLIDDVIEKLKTSNINHFKEIYDLMKRCEKTLDHLARYYQLGNYQAVDGVYYTHLYRIGLFMVNSFNVSNAKDIYDNFYMLIPVVKLHDEKLYQMLQEIIFYNDHFYLFTDVLSQVYAERY